MQMTRISYLILEYDFTSMRLRAYGSGSAVKQKKKEYRLLICLIYCADKNWGV